MNRILCLWLPNWPVQRLVSDQPELRDRPLVLHGMRMGKPVVTACSDTAAAAGVVPGMPPAEARTLWPATDPRVCLLPHDARADRQAFVQLAYFAQRYCPRVALEEAEHPECLLLDITGCDHLFGGEEALAGQAIHDLRVRSLQARAAVADTIGAAWAFAHAAKSNPTIVPAGQHRIPVGKLDLVWLRVPGDIVRQLREFDLRTVQQLMKLPRGEVVVRFGREALVRLDQALGDVPEIMRPERFIEPVAASWTFEDATAQRWVLEQVVEHLLQTMLERIAREELGVERLICELRTVSQEQISLSVGLLQPSDSLRYLLELAGLHLEKLRLPAEVDQVQLRAIVAPRAWRQGRIFEVDRRNTQDQCRALVERLSNRVGEQAVLRAYLRPEAQPEFSWGYVPWLGGLVPGQVGSSPTALSRPVDLRESPAPVGVESEGTPTRLVWRERSYVVVRAWGPERIETSWWRGRDVRRDYYRVEVEGGRRFWLYLDLDRRAWFLHGIYG